MVILGNMSTASILGQYRYHGELGLLLLGVGVVCGRTRDPAFRLPGEVAIVCPLSTTTAAAAAAVACHYLLETVLFLLQS